MTRFHIALAVLFSLAACAQPAATVPAGTISFAGQSYPILATASGWAVQSGERTIACRAATETDCYWSLRNVLNAQDQLDSLTN